MEKIVTLKKLVLRFNLELCRLEGTAFRGEIYFVTQSQCTRFEISCP